MFSFPFSSLTNFDLHRELFDSSSFEVNVEIKNLFNASINRELFGDLNFDYYTPGQLSSLHNRFHKDLKLSIFHVNIRSLNANFDKLCSVLYCCSIKFDVIVLTELGVTNLAFYNNIFGNDYKFFFEIPLNSSVGGVGIFVKSKLKPYLRSDLDPNIKNTSFESLWIEITLDSCKYFIGGFYRHPNTPINVFKDYLLTSLDKLKSKKRIWVIGDINLNLNNFGFDTGTTEFVNDLCHLNFLPYVFLPTRITNTSATIIDHIYTNFNFVDSTFCKAGLLCSDISDHCANFMFICCRKTVKKYANRPFTRLFNNPNINRFNADLSLINWGDLYSTTDVNDAYSKFSTFVTDLFNKKFSLVRKSRKSMASRKPWISQSLLKSIDTKSQLYKKWIFSNNPLDERIYKNYSLALRKLIKKAESNYFTKVCDTKLNSIKTVWRNLNSICNFNRNNNSKHLVDKLFDNNVLLTDAPSIANHFNNYFASIGENLSKLIVSNNSDYKSFLGKQNYYSFVCDPVTANELYNHLSNLNNSKSPSVDGFSNYLIKNCRIALLYPLLHIYNLSFNTGIFPSLLKVAKVLPLFKNGDSRLASNYRPISMLSPFVKLLEKLMLARLTSFFQKFNLLYDFQFGFRKNHSTKIAVLDAVTLIETELSKSNLVMGVFLDFKKAFETIDLHILIKKLEHYGIRGHMLNWFESYLFKRTQFVNCNEYSSNTSFINYGVPQGSVLGPFLFLVFINDIAQSTKGGAIKLFADDTNVFIVSNDLKTLYTKANDVLNDIRIWVNANKLTVNLDKTNYILFKPKALTSQSLTDCNLTLYFNNLPIKRVSQVKYLGVWIDENLFWDYHISQLILKLRAFISIIYKVKHAIPMFCRRILYFSLIHSSLFYCVEVYGKARNYVLHPLEIKTNSLLRLLQDKPRNTDVRLLYSTYNTLPITLLFKFQIAKLMHSVIYSKESLPKSFIALFTINAEVHSHFTRSSGEFNLQRTTNCNAINFLGPSIWYKLSLSLRSITNFTEFSHLYKSNLTSELLP